MKYNLPDQVVKDNRDSPALLTVMHDYISKQIWQEKSKTKIQTNE